MTSPAALAAMLAAVAGCSDGPKIVKVSGVAKHKGEPVPFLRITFQPDKGRPSWGDTDANGRFSLEYDAEHKGALVGHHTVSAIWRPGTPDEEMQMASEGPRSKTGVTQRTIQEKYGNSMQSPLKMEITGPSDNLEVTFD
jgi:hypothetical protein